MGRLVAIKTGLAGSAPMTAILPCEGVRRVLPVGHPNLCAHRHAGYAEPSLCAMGYNPTPTPGPEVQPTSRPEKAGSVSLGEAVGAGHVRRRDMRNMSASGSLTPECRRPDALLPWGNHPIAAPGAVTQPHRSEMWSAAGRPAGGHAGARPTNLAENACYPPGICRTRPVCWIACLLQGMVGLQVNLVQ
jgi:hypothetical protein